MKKIIILALATIAMLSCKQAAPVEPEVTPTSDSVVVEAEPLADLPNMETKTMVNFKGGEGSIEMKLFQQGETKIMLCTLPPHTSVGYHVHDTSMEVVLVQEGTATIDLDNKGPQEYAQGQAHYCAKGHGHSISNNTDHDVVIYNVVAAQ